MAWLRFGSFWIYPLLSSALLWGAWPGRSGGPPALLWPVLTGLVSWSFLEYWLHRGFFHLRPRSQQIRRLLHPLHCSHHQDPRNPDKVLVRLLYSLPVSGLLLALLWLILGDLFRASGVLSGVWLGFLYYESVHYRLHQSTRSGGLIGRQRRHHFCHHFVDPECCFGVTSPLWDILFGTYRRVGLPGKAGTRVEAGD